MRCKKNDKRISWKKLEAKFLQYKIEINLRADRAMIEQIFT